MEYVDYIDGEVLAGFFKVVHESLNFLVENMQGEVKVSRISRVSCTADLQHLFKNCYYIFIVTKQVKHPLFEVTFELEGDETFFHPSLAHGISGGFYDFVESLIEDVYKTATLVSRVSVTSKFSYKVNACLIAHLV